MAGQAAESKILCAGKKPGSRTGQIAHRKSDQAGCQRVSGNGRSVRRGHPYVVAQSGRVGGSSGIEMEEI